MIKGQAVKGKGLSDEYIGKKDLFKRGQQKVSELGSGKPPAPELYLKRCQKDRKRIGFVCF